MASQSSGQHGVPTWSGDPVEFETFAIACRWYEKALKESERKQAASRVWAKLTGPAKAVVRNLSGSAVACSGSFQAFGCLASSETTEW